MSVKVAVAASAMTLFFMALTGAGAYWAMSSSLPPERLGTWSIAFGLATVPAVLGFGALLGRRLTARLTDLERAASAYALGKDGPRDFAIPGGDEIARLATAFAGMAERLDDAGRDLDRHGQSLLANAERVAHVGSAVWDLRSGRQVWSDEFHAILGLDPRDCLAGPEMFLDRVHPSDRAQLLAAIEAARDTGLQVVRDFRAVRLDGGEGVVHLRADVALDETGDAVRLDVAIQDVTERKMLDQRLDALVRDLRRSNEELEQFAYVASHDLRQPLRVIGSYVTLLEQELDGQLSDDARQFVDFVRDGVRRMDALIVDLLAYSRVGRMSRDDRIESGAAAAAAVADLRIEISEAEADVVVARRMPVVVGDSSELERLFRNLIGNAIKYRSPERPPSVTVGVADRGLEWEFTISDNGIGIAPEHSERVFGIFQRLHARHEYEGTGIGLAICKKIVERHGGTIRLDAERGQGTPGQGTIVRFTWPKRRTPADEVTTATARVPPDQAHQ